MAESHLRQEDNSAAARALVASALRTLDAEAGGVAALAAALRDGLGRPFVAAVDRIRAAKGRLIVTGMGKSGHIGRKIAATFASTGTPAYFVHPGEASHGDLGVISPDDLIMALSWSGETAELKNLIDYSRRFRIGLIAMTAEPDSTLGRAADVVLALPQAREACPHNLAPTTSSLMQLALGDALAVALLESRGFTALDFGLLHPAGRLGAMLKFVRDVMHTGAALPLSPAGTRMSEAIVEMTGKGFGCVGITDRDGRLAGIITDGDLRRHMRADLLAARVDDVMSSAPENGAARPACERSARNTELREGYGVDRGRRRPAGRDRARARPVADRRCLKHFPGEAWPGLDPGWMPVRLKKMRPLSLIAAMSETSAPFAPPAPPAPLSPPSERPAPERPSPPRERRQQPRVLYVVSEDWYFLSHRLPMARAARDAGFEVHVATRVADGGPAIEREGFVLHRIPFKRGRLAPFTSLRTILALQRLHRTIDPTIVHHVALQTSVLGTLAAGKRSVARVNALTGLGYAFTANTPKARLLRRFTASALRYLFDRSGSVVLVQNPDDAAALVALGVPQKRIVLIPGSGVDVGALKPLPEPSGMPTIGFVGRLLEDKGIRTLIEAHLLLRLNGVQVQLRIAGTPDPANPASVTQDEAAGWVHEPGIAWAGHVDGHFRVLGQRACGGVALAARGPAQIAAGGGGLRTSADRERRPRLPRDRAAWRDRTAGAGRRCARARGGDPAAHHLAGRTRPLWRRRAQTRGRKLRGRHRRPHDGRALSPAGERARAGGRRGARRHEPRGDEQRRRRLAFRAAHRGRGGGRLRRADPVAAALAAALRARAPQRALVAPGADAAGRRHRGDCCNHDRRDRRRRCFARPSLHALCAGTGRNVPDRGAGRGRRYSSARCRPPARAPGGRGVRRRSLRCRQSCGSCRCCRGGSSARCSCWAACGSSISSTSWTASTG